MKLLKLSQCWMYHLMVIAIAFPDPNSYWIEHNGACRITGILDQERLGRVCSDTRFWINDLISDKTITGE